MSVPGKDAFTNSRARLSSPYVPLNEYSRRVPRNHRVSQANGTAPVFPACDIAEFRRLGARANNGPELAQKF